VHWIFQRCVGFERACFQFSSYFIDETVLSTHFVYEKVLHAYFKQSIFYP
jgi:hypothetical protein